MTVMSGKEALMELLGRNKVKYVFGLPGATEVVFYGRPGKASRY